MTSDTLERVFHPFDVNIYGIHENLKDFSSHSCESQSFPSFGIRSHRISIPLLTVYGFKRKSNKNRKWNAFVKSNKFVMYFYLLFTLYDYDCCFSCVICLPAHRHKNIIDSKQTKIGGKKYKMNFGSFSCHLYNTYICIRNFMGHTFQ